MALAKNGTGSDFGFFDRTPLRKWEIWAKGKNGRSLLDVVGTEMEAKEILEKWREKSTDREYEVLERKDPLASADGSSG